jgi:hypothetical protein
MTSFFKRLEIGDWRFLSILLSPISIFLFAALLILLLYLLTLARVPVYGDPTEYTVVAHVLGFAHPPGYAFFTLLGKLAQSLIPIGEISWRMHLLAALSAAAAALFAAATVWTIGGSVNREPYSVIREPYSVSRQRNTDYGTRNTDYGIRNTDYRNTAVLFTALLIASGANVWQHAIHANPHVVTAVFLLANLFLLTKLWATANPRWLYLFALSLGLGLTHHPLTVMAWPAYAIFILVVRPSIWKEWRVLLGMVLSGLLGLTVWLYFPLRSPPPPSARLT